MTRSRWWGVFRLRPVLAAAIAAAWIAGCGAPKRAPSAEAESEAHAHEEHGAETPHVELSPEAIQNARLRLGVAAPAKIALTAEVPGEVHLNPERVLEVRPRFPGVIRELRKRIGDRVSQGEVVAVVQSNESLTDYEIVSSMPGTVISRSVVTGQSADQSTALYVIADLSSVWVDFAIFPQYVGRIRPGVPVKITVHHHPDLSATSTIHYVGPLLEQDTRVSSARVVLPNRDGRWQPGLFVTARVELEQRRAAVAVPDDAVVRTAEGSAVFRARGHRFDLQRVVVGGSDGVHTEILQGLAAGDSIVIENAFILKSELGKAEVEHEH